MKLRTEQARINQNITALKQIPSILKEKAEYISKNIDKLNPDDVDIMQQKLGMLEKGNAKVYLDENKIPRINIYKVDENGQVTDILEKEQTVADFITGINPHMKSNYDDLLKKAVENTAVSDITTQKGIYISQEKKVDDKVAEEKAETFAEMIINNPNEAYAFSKAKGIDLNDKQALKEAVKKDYKNSLDVLRKEDIDSGLISATKPTKGEKEDKPITFNDKPIFVTKTGVKPGTNLKLEKDNIGYSFGNATLDKKGGKTKTAKGIYANPETGQVQLWVEESGYVSVSEDKSELTASGKAKLEREKKKLGAKFNYNEFVSSGVLEPSDYSSQKTSTKDTQEKLIDLDTQAGQAMEYADLLGVSVRDLKFMYLEKARRDKSQRPTSNKQKVDEYGVPIK